MSLNDDRVLVVAPTGQDAILICEQLQNAGLAGAVCTTLEEFANQTMDGAATGVIAEEALTEEGINRLIEALSAQPAWSDLPIVILTSFEHIQDAGLVQRLAEAGNITLLERPLRVMTLLMTVQAAIRARRRQYDFREYLQQYERYQEQVRQAQKLESLGVLAGGIAHDFNNILTGILGNASLAAELLPPGDPARPLIDDVVTSSERAAALTNQMLAYAGKGNFIVRPVDISATVRKLGDFFRASIPKRVEVSLNLASDLPPVEADESQVEQIVMNLVMNAAEAIPEDQSGTVRVTTAACDISPDSPIHFQGAAATPGTYSTFEVSDDGTGMDEKTLARIFDPFFTTKFLGRGLGLAAVQGIVRRHRGGLTVESTPGKGTTFRIYFPAADAKAPAHEPEPEMVASGPSRATVLVVDDEEIVRRTASALLTRHGYSVLTAENGKAAAEVYSRHYDRINLVLLDMTMPVMDGEAALRELKAIRGDVKVILSSGFNEAEAVRRFAGAGLAGFIQKPYTTGRLMEKIKRTLENGQATQGNASRSAGS
jgi:signal transduction histidine kinase/ActR/RegA family two-component response regulator